MSTFKEYLLNEAKAKPFTLTQANQIPDDGSRIHFDGPTGEDMSIGRSRGDVEIYKNGRQIIGINESNWDKNLEGNQAIFDLWYAAPKSMQVSIDTSSMNNEAGQMLVFLGKNRKDPVRYEHGSYQGYRNTDGEGDKLMSFGASAKEVLKNYKSDETARKARKKAFDAEMKAKYG